MPELALDFLHKVPPVAPVKFWDDQPDRRLAWSEYGDPGGRPVFLYHGWPGSMSQARLAHHLALERGIRLIAMDRPGIGQSTYNESRSLADWPPLMAGFANHLGIAKFGQIGVSGGGPYVLQCAADLPDRLTSSAILSGMIPLEILENGADHLHLIYRAIIPFRKFPAWFFVPLIALAKAGTRLDPDRFPLRQILPLIPGEEGAAFADPEVWEIVTESIRAGLSGEPRGILHDARIYFQPVEIEPQALSHRVRLWHGGKDHLIRPEMARAFAARFSKIELTVMPALGHISLAVRAAATALDSLRKSS